MPALGTRGAASARGFGFAGGAASFLFTIASNQTNANLRTLAVSAGWNQSSPVFATISGGVIISSNSTGTPALTVNGSFPGGVTLTNNGVIVGMGGAGGLAPNQNIAAGSAGGAGGTALSVSVALTLANNGTMAGGGGGGGGGQSGALDICGPLWESGGGGGGGRSSNAANSAGGGGAGFGAGGARLASSGGAGTYSSAGTGGLGAAWNSNNQGGTGGNGGNWGTAGSTGSTYGPVGSVYGTVGPYSGGGAGSCTSGGVNITYTATGTRNGPLN